VKSPDVGLTIGSLETRLLKFIRPSLGHIQTLRLCFVVCITNAVYFCCLLLWLFAISLWSVCSKVS